MAEEGSRACKVSCGDVTLKITLTPKLLKKPFEEAVLAPFLKAYSKKAGLYGGRLPAPSDVSCVTVDDTMLGDHSLPGAVILLAHQTVEIDVTLKPPPSPAAQPGSVPAFCDNPFGCADPFASPAAAGASARDPPPGGTVDFDGKSEVERLKEQRRAARLVRENAEAAIAGAEAAVGGAALSEAAMEFPPGTRATVTELSSDAGLALNGQIGTVLGFLPAKDRFQLLMDASGQTINVRRANLELKMPVEGGAASTAASGAGSDAHGGAQGGAKGGRAGSGAGSSEAAAAGSSETGAGVQSTRAGNETDVLAQLCSLEEQCDSISASLAACAAALVKIDFEDVEADEAVAACNADASAALASLAKLSMRLDEIEIGESASEQEREAARARRRAIRNRLEGEVGAAADELRTALVQARRRVE